MAITQPARPTQGPDLPDPISRLKILGHTKLALGQPKFVSLNFSFHTLFFSLLNLFDRMPGTGQSLKAAITARVEPAAAIRNWSNNYSLGYAENCPVHSADLDFDIYGRVVPHTTINTLGNTDGCGERSFYNTQRLISVENLARPYINVAQAGSRWGGEPMGVARNRAAYNIYEHGRGGSFVRTYATPNDAPPDPMQAGCGVGGPDGLPYLNNGYPRHFAGTMEAQVQRIQM